MNQVKDKIQSLLKEGYKIVGNGPIEEIAQDYSGRVSSEQSFAIIFECKGRLREFVKIPQEYRKYILDYIKTL